MKVTKFLNIDIEPAPPELELEVEMQCREIMTTNDLNGLKRYLWLNLAKNLMETKSIITFL